MPQKKRKVVASAKKANKPNVKVNDLSENGKDLPPPPAEPMDASDGSGSDSDDTNSYDGNEMIDVMFEGRNPQDNDFHGIRQLLKQLFLKAPIDLSELTDLIIGQNYVGSIISQANDDDDDDDDEDEDNDDGNNINDDANDSNVVFAITTAINITDKSKKDSVQQIRAYVLDKADKYADEATKIQIHETFANPAKTIGLIINERFVNIPPQVTIPSMESLLKEIQRAVRKNMPYKFDYYLMIIKFHRRVAKKTKTNEDIYSNEEEEIYTDEAVANFEYSVKNEIDSSVTDAGNNALVDDPSSSGGRLTPFRRILLFDANKLPQLINKTKELIA